MSPTMYKEATSNVVNICLKAVGQDLKGIKPWVLGHKFT